MTLIPSLPKLTLFVIFGVLERNIPVKQTGEVQQLCVQSCVRVLKNTKDMEINITIALTPRMSLTKGTQNQFFPESPEEWLFLAYLPVIIFTYEYYCKINRPPSRKTDKIPWNSTNKFNSNFLKCACQLLLTEERPLNCTLQQNLITVFSTSRQNNNPLANVASLLSSKIQYGSS